TSLLLEGRDLPRRDKSRRRAPTAQVSRMVAVTLKRPDVQRYPDDTRRAPAKPPAQPVGMAESDMNKSSWQKPACTHSAHRRRCVLELGPQIPQQRCVSFSSVSFLVTSSTEPISLVSYWTCSPGGVSAMIASNSETVTIISKSPFISPLPSGRPVLALTYTPTPLAFPLAGDRRNYPSHTSRAFH